MRWKCTGKLMVLVDVDQEEQPCCPPKNLALAVQ